MGSEAHSEECYSGPFWGIGLIDWMLATVEVRSVLGELWRLDSSPWQTWLCLASSGSAPPIGSQVLPIRLTWVGKLLGAPGSSVR